MSDIFQQTAGDKAKATVYLAHWLTVIVSNTHCGVGTDVEVIASYNETRSTIFYSIINVFCFSSRPLRRPDVGERDDGG